MKNETAASQSTKAESNAYCAGHDPEELRRLEEQGRFLAPSTRAFLTRAGVVTGMRVLDVGCGTGDVSFIAADLVGPAGEVVGFDRAETAVSAASARARAKGLANVRFVQCDIDHAADLAAGGLFDAVVSRAVLAHVANPLESIRKLLRLVRPGGVVGFQEPDLVSGYWGTQELTILEQIHSVVLKCVERGIMARDLLPALVAAFDEAGMSERRIIRSGAIDSVSDDDACAWVADIAQMLHGVAQRMGFPLPSYDPKTVAMDFRKEVASKKALFIPWQWLGAAGRLPAVRATEE